MVTLQIEKSLEFATVHINKANLITAFILLLEVPSETLKGHFGL